jgi:hypothetical protein
MCHAALVRRLIRKSPVGPLSGDGPTRLGRSKPRKSAQALP